MQPFSLYWFAAQQQTTTSGKQKFDFCYQKLDPELIQFSTTF